MILSELLKNINIETISNETDIDKISNIQFDSRKVEDNSLFVAIRGYGENGELYIEQAIQNGAIAIISESPIDEEIKQKYKDIIYIKVKDARETLSIVVANLYNNPSHAIKLVGITGTNGKTTTATLLYNLFTQMGYSCGLLSTIENKVGDKIYPATHTTPDPIELNKLLAKMCDEGCEYCFMEVSSHSLSQDRIAGLRFTGALFSNITHDHLDYHKTYAEYIKCKKRLFDTLPKDSFALTNIDDKNGEIMTQNSKANIYTYSCRAMADFRCKIAEKSFDGMLLKVDETEVWTKFIGKHNAYNLLAVYGTAILLGAKKEDILLSLSNLNAVSGRLEYIKGGNDILAIVDYAHTPDALVNILSTIKDIGGSNHKLICVFGCGGDRDKTKRPEMGKIAAQYADKIIVTSDNPRTEDPNQIIKDIKDGMNIRARAKSLFIVDRAEAIRTAIFLAEQGSVIIVAGKGHETYQIINKEKIHFDDKEIISDTFKELELNK